jgi:hypothetical protein
MKHLVWGLLAMALTAAPGKEAFTGVITDSMCARGDHSQMKMGSTDAECTRACVEAHGAEYVLFDGKSAYTLRGDQTLPEKFAGQKVSVTGTLDAKTHAIQIDTITPKK